MKRYPRFGPFDVNRTEGIRPGKGRLRAALTGGQGVRCACAKRYLRSGSFDLNRTEEIRPGKGRLRAALLLSTAVRSPELRQA